MIPHFSDNGSGRSASHASDNSHVCLVAGCPPGCLNGHSLYLLPNIAAIRGEVMGHPLGFPTNKFTLRSDKQLHKRQRSLHPT